MLPHGLIATLNDWYPSDEAPKAYPSSSISFLDLWWPPAKLPCLSLVSATCLPVLYGWCSEFSAVQRQIELT